MIICLGEPGGFRPGPEVEMARQLAGADTRKRSGGTASKHSGGGARVVSSSARANRAKSARTSPVSGTARKESSAKSQSSASASGTGSRKPSARTKTANPRNAKPRPRRKLRKNARTEIIRDVIAIIGAGIILFTALSLYLPLVTDNPQPVGMLGAALSDILIVYLSFVAYLLPVLAALYWVRFVYPESKRLADVSGMSFFALFFIFLFAGIFGASGEAGRLTTETMESFVGVFYPALLAVLFFIILAIILGRSIIRPTAHVASTGARGIGAAFSYMANAIRLALSLDYDESAAEVALRDDAKARWESDAEEYENDAQDDVTITGLDSENASLEDSDDEETDVPITGYSEDNGEISDLVSDEDLEFVVEKDSGQVEFRFKSDEHPYALPPLSLLLDAPFLKNDKADLLDKATVIERTLTEFRIDARVNHIQEGPRVTRFEIEIGPGINVSKIHNIADNLALELAVSAVRIEAPVPGKSAVGVEVPNKHFQLITLKSILDSPEVKNARGIATVCLGRDIAGKPVVGNLAKMPHLLVAGATGSGKSVCLNTIIASILFRATPEEIKFVLIDPKWVELAVYKELPHLITPVVHTRAEIIGTFGWVIKEMERRYRLLQEFTAKNIASFNALVESDERLPYIIIIVDELADLFMIAGKVAEKQITRIAQKARAVGIHLVVATQRPDVKVITGTIKANIPSRIAFAVAQQVDSRTILDMNGAEKLLGEGDMLFSPIGAMKPSRVQGAFVSDEEVHRIVEFICSQRAPKFNPDIEKMIKPEDDFDELAGDSEKSDQDELYGEARDIVLTEKRCSISYLQRRLRIGYQRSARIVDSLMSEGIVEEDPETGSYRIAET